MIGPFEIDAATLDYISAIAHSPLAADAEYRPLSAHGRVGEPWALVYSDGSSTGQTLAVGSSEEEVRETLADLLAAFNLRQALEDLNVHACRYDELMQAVEAAAADLGLEISDIAPLSFVKAWLEISDDSAAGWLQLCPLQIEAMVRKVACRAI